MKKSQILAAMWLITYVALLALFIANFSELRGFLSGVLSIFSPLMIGFALAFILDRPCEFFQRWFRKIPKLGQREGACVALSVLSSYVLLLVVICAIIGFVVPQFVESMQIFVGSLEGYLTNAQGFLNGLLIHLNLETLDLSNLSSTLNDMLNGIIEGALSVASTTLSHVVTITSAIISVIITIALAFVFSIYFLAGKETLMGQAGRVCRAYLPHKVQESLRQVTILTANTFTRFIGGQVTEACILGILCGIGMLFIHADYAALIGVIVGCTALIPVVGAYAGAILSALLLLMVSPMTALAFLIFVLILQQIEGNVIYPRVVGTSIGLPGIWVLTAVMVGAGLGGVPGVLLSVPIASVVYTLLKQDVKKRLDGEEQPQEIDATENL